MVSSLLNIQKRREDSDLFKDKLLVTQNRIKLIGLIHEHLYVQEDVTRVNLQLFIPQLVKMIMKELNVNESPQLTYHIVPGSMRLDVMVPLSMILHELITNAIKYGFTDNDDPELHVEAYEKNRMFWLIVQNNSRHVEQTFHEGFGLNIIESMLNSLDGQMVNDTSEGFKTIICIKDYIFDSNEDSRSNS